MNFLITTCGLSQLCWIGQSLNMEEMYKFLLHNEKDKKFIQDLHIKCLCYAYMTNAMESHVVNDLFFRPIQKKLIQKADSKLIDLVLSLLKMTISPSTVSFESIYRPLYNYAQQNDPLLQPLYD